MGRVLLPPGNLIALYLIQIFFKARKVLKGWKMSQVSDKIEKSE